MRKKTKDEIIAAQSKLLDEWMAEGRKHIARLREIDALKAKIEKLEKAHEK